MLTDKDLISKRYPLTLIHSTFFNPTAAINPCQAYPEIHINEQKFKIK